MLGTLDSLFSLHDLFRTKTKPTTTTLIPTKK